MSDTIKYKVSSEPKVDHEYSGGTKYYKDKDLFCSAVSLQLAKDMQKAELKADELSTVEYGHAGRRLYIIGSSASLRTGINEEGFFITDSFNNVK